MGKAGVKIRFPYELELKATAPTVEVITDSGKRNV